ncbi:MAG: hypothetical protein QXN33_00170 [Candidatus Bathyarchaeia archaeon]
MTIPSPPSLIRRIQNWLYIRLAPSRRLKWSELVGLLPHESAYKLRLIMYIAAKGSATRADLKAYFESFLPKATARRYVNRIISSLLEKGEIAEGPNGLLRLTRINGPIAFKQGLGFSWKIIGLGIAIVQLLWAWALDQPAFIAFGIVWLAVFALIALEDLLSSLAY